MPRSTAKKKKKKKRESGRSPPSPKLHPQPQPGWWSVESKAGCLTPPSRGIPLGGAPNQMPPGASVSGSMRATALRGRQLAKRRAWKPGEGDGRVAGDLSRLA